MLPLAIWLFYVLVGIGIRKLLDWLNHLLRDHELLHRLPGGVIITTQGTASLPDRDSGLQNLKRLLGIAHTRDKGLTERHSLFRVFDDIIQALQGRQHELMNHLRLLLKR